MTTPRTSIRERVAGWFARCRFGMQICRLRIERLLAWRTKGPRVLATACWDFPIYSQTFVYQELTQLIHTGFAVRFVYSKSNGRDTLPSQFEPLWRARRRLELARAVCESSEAYFRRAMPHKVDALIRQLAGASGLSEADVLTHHHVREAFAFARLAAAWEPQYLHSYFFYEGSLFVYVAAFLLDRPRGVSTYADHLLADYELKVVPLHLEQSAITIATSNRIRDELLGIAPATSPATILVKPNGINSDKFPSTIRSEPAEGEPYRVVCVSRIEPKKGLLYLVRAVGLLRKRGVAVAAHIIGAPDNTEASRTCHAELVAEIAALNVASSVQLVGRKNEAEINRYFAAAHIFVAPFVETAGGDKDGIPTALLEGMASGLAAVVTDAGSILEVVAHERDALVVPQRNAEALAAAVERLCRQQALRHDLGRAAAATIRERFDARECERPFHTRLRGLLRGRTDLPPGDGRLSSPGEGCDDELERTLGSRPAHDGPRRLPPAGRQDLQR